MEEVDCYMTSSNKGRSRPHSFIKISKSLVEFSCLIKLTKTTIKTKIQFVKVNNIMFLVFTFW